MESQRDLLQNRVNLLEKSNRELSSMHKSMEDTIKEIAGEKDQEKKMNLINVNLFRRKSLLRAEKKNSSASPSPNTRTEPEAMVG